MDLLESSVVSKRHPWELARAKFVLNNFIEPGVPQGGKVVDIGAGDMFFAKLLAKLNYKIWAVDTAFGNNSDLVSTSVKTSNNYESINIMADAILLMDVIEHVKDDEGFLSDLVKQSFVDDDSKLLITVPAFKFLYTAHDDYLGHFRRYDKLMLESVCGKAGWKIVDSGYFFSSLVLLRLVEKLNEMIFGRKNLINTKTGSWKAGFLVTWLLCFILKIDASLGRIIHKLGFDIPGLSVYALCKKQ